MRKLMRLFSLSLIFVNLFITQVNAQTIKYDTIMVAFHLDTCDIDKRDVQGFNIYYFFYSYKDTVTTEPSFSKVDTFKAENRRIKIIAPVDSALWHTGGYQHIFKLTAYDTAGNESEFSNIFEKTVYFRSDQDRDGDVDLDDQWWFDMVANEVGLFERFTPFIFNESGIDEVVIKRK
jgi:hypothetical protein